VTICILHVQAQCENEFLEVIPEEAESAELSVEDGVSHLLADFFTEVAVDDVTIRCLAAVQAGFKRCSIGIRAFCSCDSFSELPRKQEQLMYAIEERIGLLVSELFGQVNVDSVTLTPSHDVCGNDLAYTYWL
jgi:hypothetical protein